MKSSVIIFGHGILSRKEEWTPLLTQLAQKLPGINIDALDMRNHGASFHSVDNSVQALSLGQMVTQADFSVQKQA